MPYYIVNKSKGAGSRRLVILGVLAIASAATTLLLRAQSNSTPRPSFEVASIRPGDPRQGITLNAVGGTFTCGNYPLRDAILLAYHLPNWELSGVPGDLGNERFNIVARLPEGFAARGNPRQDKPLMMMLQALLEDRFKLKLRTETKQGSVYVLAAAKRGSKLSVAAPEDPKEHRIAFRRGQIVGEIATMDDLAYALSDTLELPVVNETAISGLYNFTVEYSRRDDDGLPSLFTAIEQQIGLKLESRKGPIKMYIVDHLEKPGSN
jgi:bla regulator protein blaR1